MSLTKEIESRIEKFVAELNELVRKEAVEAVATALGTGTRATSAAAAPARRGPGRPPRAPNGAAAAPAAAAPKAAKGPRVRARKKGEKRTQAELAQIESSLESHVRNNPGQGIEAIGKALSLPTSELARPMKKLIAKGAVKTVGEKRATKYFPGDGAPAAASAKPARAAKKSGGKKKSKKK